jgi:hypothetical protein
MLSAVKWLLVDCWSMLVKVPSTCLVDDLKLLSIKVRILNQDELECLTADPC